MTDDDELLRVLSEGRRDRDGGLAVAERLVATWTRLPEVERERLEAACFDAIQRDAEGWDAVLELLAQVGAPYLARRLWEAYRSVPHDDQWRSAVLLALTQARFAPALEEARSSIDRCLAEGAPGRAMGLAFALGALDEEAARHAIVRIIQAMPAGIPIQSAAQNLILQEWLNADRGRIRSLLAELGQADASRLGDVLLGLGNALEQPWLRAQLGASAQVVEGVLSDVVAQAARGEERRKP